MRFLTLFLFLGVFTRARAADIEFVTNDLPWAVVDKPYSPDPIQVRASGRCPLGGVGFSVVSGILPPGVEMSKAGYLSGTPVRTGSFEIAVRVSNGCTWTTRHYVLVVTGAPVLIVSPSALSFNGPGEASLRVSANWPRLAYRVSSGANWLKLAPAHGFTPRAASAMAEDTVAVRADTGGLKPGRYSATITVSAWQALKPELVAVDLTVP